MPERAPHDDAALRALCSQLALDDLPEPLAAAVAETLGWVLALEDEASSAGDQAVRRPR
jgi:hypothetical protein